MGKHYVIEHMEPDEASPSKPLPDWVLLEYKHILQQVGVFDDTASTTAAPAPDSPASRQRTESATSITDISESRVTFSHLSKATCEALTDELSSAKPPSSSASKSEQPIVRHIRTLSGVQPTQLARPERVTCSILSVLDLMSASRVNINSVCLLDPKAPQQLHPSDAGRFKWFLFGGILGDDPPRDRTVELRAFGFPGRNLGAMQMTTDTAVAVTKRAVEDGLEMEGIKWVDRPKLKYRKGESVEMPFRYLKGEDGEPIMPEGMREHIGKDLDRPFEV